MAVRQKRREHIVKKEKKKAKTKAGAMRRKRAGKLSRLGSMDLREESRLAKKAAETRKMLKRGNICQIVAMIPRVGVGKMDL